MRVKVGEPAVLFFAFVVHVGAVLGVLAFGPRAQEVVIARVQAAHAPYFADDVQVERQVVPERLRERDAALVQVGAPVQLVPRRVQKLGVEQLVGMLAEFPLAGKHLVGRGARLAVELVFRVVRVDVEAGHGQIQLLLGGEAVQVFQHRRLAPVVAVHEVEELAARLPNGHVARPGGAAVFLVDDADPAVACRQVVARLSAAVGASIVHENDLEVAERLCLQRSDRAADPRLHVVDGDDDADGGVVWHDDLSGAYPVFRCPILSERL